MAVVKIEAQYNFYSWLGTNNQEVECKVLRDRTLNEICKKFKGNTIKDLVCSFHCLILAMKLAILDKDIRKHLLYPPLSMQYTIKKQQMLLDILLA